MSLLTKTTTIASTLAATTVVIMMATASASAAFNICKDVQLKFNNNSGSVVRLVDIDYYDYGSKKWRSEPTSNRIIKPGKYIELEKNLEKVNQGKTRIRAQVQYLKSNGKWAWKKHNFRSGKATCKTGKKYSVSIK